MAENKLKLYNTLNRKKEVFKPLKNKSVGVYTCGPTVYWYQHIGNLRSYVSWDILKRVLLANGYKIRHVMNVTDVGHLTSDRDTGEDKIERAAKKERKTPKEISNFYLSVFKKDLKKLKILPADKWPKATEHIEEQIELVKSLEKKGFTYKTKDGIYFDTSKLKDYGKLANLKPRELKAGKRVDVKGKKNKTDFALWKFSSSSEGKRLQEWGSPWGKGFPGWHLECSAMASKYLGKRFDIHTGGQEHIPVHHTNEIAQSEAAFGEKPWVKYWLHSAWLLSKGKKVSKSKGGLYTLSELEEKGYTPLDLKYFFFSAHYRRPLSFTLQALDNTKNSLERLREIISKLDKTKKKNKKNIASAKNQFLTFLNDDLNVPRALSYMWEILREGRLKGSEKYELVLWFDKVFGLDLDKPTSVKKVKIPKKVKELAEKRESYRHDKKWEKSDELRERVKKLGYLIEDTETGYNLKKI